MSGSCEYDVQRAGGLFCGHHGRVPTWWSRRGLFQIEEEGRTTGAADAAGCNCKTPRLAFSLVTRGRAFREPPDLNRRLTIEVPAETAFKCLDWAPPSR